MNINDKQKFFFQKLNFGEEAAGGLAAGIVGTVIGFPLDLVKTRMQTQNHSGGMTSVALHIVRTEGIASLYRGIAPPLLSLSVVNTIGFTSYSYFREVVFQGKNGWDYNNMLSGMMGTPFFSLITTPENFVKTQMQLDNVNTRRFQSSFHCASTLVREHGPTVLYTGHVVNTIREAAFMASYFYVYEGLRELFLDHMQAKMAVPVAGGCAGALSWFFSFPLDCIRAGVQGRDLKDKSREKGAIKILQQLLQTRGVGGLYSGVGPSIARAFLVSGSRFSAYEGALWLLRGGRDSTGRQKHE
eukprot:CAMPEP_0194253480 /NCGR_PEP_ID=MMETSP0158-20130606/29990_1 /TAXON_ID=33649 /ORGANISM="Thalassionema nitzschioides, Strain L26-B" /LENGTH=299 /DNA_ID=CAMNT_0038991203 /DNA_START=214 /DNA_END=1116 /DNA_ORIENTATION=-